MSGESKHVKAKIAAGYLLLLAACLAAVVYVYRMAVLPAGADDGAYAELRSKRDVAAQTLYHLYQAEGYAQLMTAGYRSYAQRYGDELHTVRNFLDSLRELERDTAQMLRLDSISRLIADKEQRTLGLIRSLRSGGTSGLLNKNIEELIRRRDTLRAERDSARRERGAVSADTVWTPFRHRDFFRRLSEWFVPPVAADTTRAEGSRSLVDSLPASAVTDTIVSVLRGLQDRVTGERIEIYDRAWNEGIRLSYSSRLVNEQIFRLLSDFQREDDAFLLRRIEEQERIRRRSSETLGWLAGAAVVLMLLFVAVLWRDINRSNRYKRELEEANREKQRLLEAREQLMLAITHDIKAPLGSLMGYIDLMSRLGTDRRQELYLARMHRAAEHLLELVRSLLDFCRLDMHKVEPLCVPFRPVQLFESVRDAFAPVAAERGIGLWLEADPSAGEEVTGDPSRIRQIVDNLVSNALKFTDQGSVTLRVRRTEEGRLLFAVRDTGRGIGPGERERIFREFVRLRSAEGSEGFGLGLSIVDRLVKLLGGRIELESEPGRGSEFTVSLPVGRPERPSVAEPRSVAGLRLLVVDDDPLQLEMTAALCRTEGIEAECCPYPEYAVRLVAERRFDAVLTDIQMPAMDGFRLLGAVHEVRPDLPVVAVSARSEPMPDGFAGVLRKPFAARELTELLARVCGAVGEARKPERETPGGFGALTAFASGDAAAERRILETFAEENAAACDRLERAVADGDDETVCALAHRMAPICDMLGEREVAAMLRMLEREGTEMSDEARRGAVERTVEKIRDLVAEARKKVSLQSE